MNTTPVRLLPELLIPTHNTFDGIDSAQHGFKDIHHSLVSQDGLLKHRQEVLMETKRNPVVLRNLEGEQNNELHHLNDSKLKIKSNVFI